MILNADAVRIPLRDSSVRLVVTSPPYLALRDYGTPGEIGQEGTPSEYVGALMLVMDELRRILTSDGSVFMVIGDKYARRGGVDRKDRGGSGDVGGRAHTRLPQKGIPGVSDGSLAGMPWRVALAAVDAGWVWRQEIVWRKPNPLPESVRNRCVRAHETILHFAKQAKCFSNPGMGAREYGHDVWDIPVASYRDPSGVRHPAVFPEALVERCVTGWSAPGDVVFDPFSGSGTTPSVANRLGRIGAGGELNLTYARVARNRLRP